MTLKLYEQISLTRDIESENLRAGDIATIVDFVDHPHGGETGAVLEIFNAVGETIGVLTVPVSAVKPLSSDYILSARSLAVA